MNRDIVLAGVAFVLFIVLSAGTIAIWSSSNAPQETYVRSNVRSTQELSPAEPVDLGPDLRLENSECPIAVEEGELVTIRWVGSDPDKDIGPQGKLTYEYSGVIGEDGVWQTNIGDAGIHQASAKIFDGEFYDETSLCIEVFPKRVAPRPRPPVIVPNVRKPVVVENVRPEPISIPIEAPNNPPVLAVVDNAILLRAGSTVEIEAGCYDPDFDEVVITYSGWMSGESKQTTDMDVGRHEVVVTCSDGNGGSDSQSVFVQVLPANRPPEIEYRRSAIYFIGYEGNELKAIRDHYLSLRN